MGIHTHIDLRATRYFLLIRYTWIKNTKEAINTFCAIFNLLFAL